MKWLAGLGYALLAAVAQAQAIPSAPPVPASEQTVALAGDEFARLSVPVIIAGRVWHFLLDTASTRTVIATDVADSLGLATGHPLQILTIAGIDTVPSVTVPELGFSDFAVHDIAAPSLARGSLGGDGLLGLDILRNNLVSINFRRSAMLTIAREPMRESRVTDPDTIVVVARSRMGELIVTDAEIGGIPVAVILDTGSEGSIGNPALARLLYRSDAGSPLGRVKLISVTGRTLPADYALVSKLAIGGVAVDNIPMAFADVATFRQFGLIRRPAILLGMQTLRLFAQVTIDFPRRRIHFTLRRKLREATTF